MNSELLSIGLSRSLKRSVEDSEDTAPRDPIPRPAFKEWMVAIIKVVGDFCNLKCTYCFHNPYDQATRHVMSRQLLKKFVKEYLALFPGRVTFIWHGGEPLLAGIEFFRAAVALQRQYATSTHSILNRIQTNGTLITPEWAGFFRDHAFGVGVSIDGDRASHNAFRTNSGGAGSFDRVREGIEILRRFGLDPGLIQTVSKPILKHQEEDFSFFVKTLGAERWGINHYLDLGEVNQGMLEHTVTPEELTDYLKRTLKLWLDTGDRRIKIREIDQFLSGALGRAAPNCTFNGTCTHYFCLEYDGRVYPCDRLSHRSELMFGNLSERSLSDVLNTSVRHQYVRDVEHLHPDCAKCEWRNACHNGCTHHRMGGPRGKYYYCETRKAVFSHVRGLVTSIADQIAEGGTDG